MRKMLLAVLALAAALTALAQQPPELRRERPDSTRLRELEYPDSMTHMRYWRPDYETIEPLEIPPAVSITSLVLVPMNNLPSKVRVTENNSLRLIPHITLSNGQAWNWGAFPDSYLDARTLSFPMPR